MGSHENEYYNQDYYQSHCGEEYERGNGWEEVFARHAQRIKREIQPQSVLDVGCAKGFLVEALRDQGIEAFGIDLSEYAVSSVREDIRPFCKVRSVLQPIGQRYDLLTCIEVLEHLDQEETALAIQHLCEASDDILFSSTPFDYAEESHVSVHTPAYWAQQFAYQGFYHDVQYDCSYISVQAMRFRRVQKSSTELIWDYENELFQKHQELLAARQRSQVSQENVQIYREAYQKHVDMINEELNPKIADLQQRLENREEEMRSCLQKREEELQACLRKKEEELQKIQQEKKDEIQNAARDLKEQIEKRCHQKLEEEIKKRKVLEQQFYEKEEVNEQLQCCRIELQQAQTTILLMQRRMEHAQRAYTKRWKAFKIRCMDRIFERRLMKKERSYWNPVFDAQYYAQCNEDIRELIGMDELALLRHFIRFGMREGRRASMEFDIDVYMRCNPDVADRWKFDKRACCLHYLEDGRLEGRRAR